MNIILLLILSFFIISGQNFDISQIWRNFETKTTIEEQSNKDNTASIVKIRGYERNNIVGRVSEGTGFIISNEGDILTNRHVVDNNNVTYKVTTSNGINYDVQNIYKSSDNDIAVIKIDPEQNKRNALQPMDLGDSNEVDPGEPISALGNDPGKIEPTLLTGTVIDTNDAVITGYGRRSVVITRNLIQTDLDLRPGNSGSPLIDSNGKAVGINTATSRRGNISFSIPINEAKEFWKTVSG